MRIILLFILFLIIIYPFASIRKDKNALYQLPCLVALTTLGFIFPSLLVNVENKQLISDNSFMLYVVNASLCLIGAYAGYSRVLSGKRKIVKENRYNRSRVIFYTSIFFIIGAILSILINPYEMGGITEGYAVFMIMFGRFVRPCSVIFLFYFLEKRSFWLYVVLLVWLYISFRFIFISGRRSEIFVFVLTVAMPLFYKGYVVSKLRYIVVALIFGMSVFILLPIAREFTKAGEFNKVQNINASEVFSNYLNGEKTNEIAEAAYNVEVVNTEGKYDFGASFYNKLAHLYVSQTLFGAEIKERAQIKTTTIEEIRGQHYNHNLGRFKFYLTPTGFADAFYSFGLFAFIIYFIFGRISRRVYDRSINSNDVFHKIFYSIYVLLIFNSVYDSISSLPTTLSLYLIVLLPVKLLSKKR